MNILNKQLTIIGGHYGTGKTEFAVNLALAAADYGQPTRLVDLDIINPYFRSYEQRALLEEAGVDVIVTSIEGTADIPAIPASVSKAFVDTETYSIFDLGGDPAGARVLGYYEPQLQEVDHDFWLVVNARRPETATVEKAYQYARDIEIMSKQKLTGIINNTHLTNETRPEDIIEGEKLALELADKCGLPLLYTTVEERLLDKVKDKLQSPIFPIEIYMLKPWEVDI